MFDSYRGILAAFAGIAALIVAFGSGAYLTAIALIEPEQPRYQSYGSADSNRDNPALAVSNLAQAQQNKTPCNEPQTETEADLCAQWRAAVAAEQSAEWTKWGVLASVVGISFLLWQIMLTREAVQDTGKATIAMERSNEIARESQRAWITVNARVISIEKKEASFQIGWEINFENVGHMPAYAFTSKTKTKWIGGDFFDRAGEELDRLLKEPVPENDIVVVPGGTSWHKGQSNQAIDFIPWKSVSALRYEAYFLLIAVARYKLLGESEWRTTAQCFLIAENISHIDDCSIRQSRLEELTVEDMHVRPIYRSKAT